ncbi:uncharacterized protein VK521_001348 [Ammospiza maritima maritima]
MDFGVKPDAITYSSSDGCRFAIDKEAISSRKRAPVKAQSEGQSPGKLNGAIGERVKDAAKSLERAAHLQPPHVYCTAHSSNSKDKYRAENKDIQTLSHLEEEDAKICARGLTAGMLMASGWFHGAWSVGKIF